MQKQYVKPQLVFYGNVEDITRADTSNAQTDNVYLSGNVVGHLTGSTDACVSGDLSNCD